MNHSIEQNRKKRLRNNFVGFGLIILAGLTGWLPGPGGVPLLIAGLAVLSRNYVWANRLMNYLLENGVKIISILFPEHRVIQWLYDIFAIGLIVGLVYLMSEISQPVLRALTFAGVFVGLAVFLINRRRLEKMSQKLRKQIK